MIEQQEKQVELKKAMRKTRGIDSVSMVFRQGSIHRAGLRYRIAEGYRGKEIMTERAQYK